ncbi:F-box/WD repeat-containing protein 5-like [Mytilus trossulus]|uniref:F-box/WD repeat-containing protein 5-like n=1 Tax=Mytilus trossulus TaxID=6551 RepID=UPI003005F279
MDDMPIACIWESIPDDIILHVFSFLPAASLLQAAQVCRCWYRVSRDELLWKDVFYRHWKIDRNIPMAPGKSSWLQEYKRLQYHTPAVESEVIRQHTDQVLHVSFSHNGKMFATSSKDGFIKVWNTTYPISLKYKENMKRFTWKYTQFSQFNESDTLLLVSGVHFGSNSTSGEIAVFSLQGNFELQARVINKPYDVFGTWYNDSHLVSGSLHWTGQLQSCSVLWLNKAFQDTENEHESVVMRLYKLKNINASSVRTVMVASCREVMETDDKDEIGKGSKRVQDKADREDNNESSSKIAKKNKEKFLGTIEYKQEYRDAEKSHKKFTQKSENSKMSNQCGSNHSSFSEDDLVRQLSDNDLPNSNNQTPIRGTKDISMPDVDKLVEKTTKCVSLSSETIDTSISGNPVNPTNGSIQDTSNSNNSAQNSSSSQCGCGSSCSCHGGMYLDGATFGSPLQSHFFRSNDHRVALDDWNPASALHMGDTSITYPNFITADSTSPQKGNILDKFLIFTQGSKTYTPHQIGIKRIKPLEKILGDERPLLPDIEFNSPALESIAYDKLDKVIDMHGHIIGLALSPDHRYLYVNCRPWPKDYDIQNPLAPPPIAQEIDIHVIDLLRLAEVGTMYRAHKAYTPNDECFFIFLDVSQQYVASGAEDKHGYIWDRHYGVCLSKFRHEDVVNCVAFSPSDSEILVTVSDDCTIKIWRSLNREKSMKFTGLFNPGLYM